MRASKITMKKYFKIIGVITTILSIGFVSSVFAAGAATSLSGVASNVSSSVGELAKILVDLALVAGIGFVMASFFKMHQHKLNPTQVPISQGITLLLIGSGLMLIPWLIPIAAKAILGQSKIATTKGTDITNLLSSGTVGG